MIIAVTGSSGFVGQKLTQKLRSLNHEVIEIDLVTGFDVTNIDSLLSIPHIDALIHLAAKSFVPDSWANPWDFYNLNLNAVINTLELCRRHNAKYVYTSSYVYGIPQYLPIDENHPLVSFNPYCDTKILGENICAGFSKLFNLNTVIIRPFNIYGPGQNENFLISKIFKDAKNGHVKLMDAIPKRDYIYVDDIVDLYVNVLDYNKSSFEIFNAGSGISYSVKEIAEMIVDLFPDKVMLEFSNEARVNEVANTIADIDKGFTYLNWKPKTEIKDGLKAIYNSIK